MPRYGRSRGAVCFYDDLFILTVFCNDFLNAVNRIQKAADRIIVIECLNEQRDVLRHINAAVPLTVKQLLWLVYKIGGEYFIYFTVGIVLIELFKALNKKTEGGEDEYSARSLS